VLKGFLEGAKIVMWTPVAAESRPLANAVFEQVARLTPSGAEDDRALVRALVRDDPTAWRTFNERYSRLILSTITRVTARFRGVLGQEDVQEIYATFCLQLLANDKHKLVSFDPARGNKLSTWIAMLASHTAYDFLRGARREPPRGSLSEAEGLAAPLPDPCENALMHERAELVAQLLAGFSAKDRRFIQLYFGEGLSPDQIAKQLSISVKTVYSKKHKIQARLELLLAEARLAA
jgi:RNA polymerase sigma-70 factor (ECF subfamily)